MRSLLILLLSASLASAGLINRPNKACGTTTYVDEVAAGCGTILASEVDGDLNLIYGEFDGNITDANVAANAGIQCSKIQANSCTGSQIQNGSICTAQIGDGCIVNADINATADIAGSKLADGTVTGAKLAVGASVHEITLGAFTPTTIFNSTAESAALASFTITATGAPIRIDVAWIAKMFWTNGFPGSQATVRLKKDGVTLSTWVLSGIGPAGSATSPTDHFPSLLVYDTPTAASHTYTITVQLSSLTDTFIINSGYLVGLEFS